MEDMKMAVTELGYMGVGAKDLDAWKDYATNILGMELRPGEDDRRCYLRMDYWHHRIVLHDDPSDDLMYLGFRTAGSDELHSLRNLLSEAGVKVRVASAEEAAERHVLELLKLSDPEGTPIEIFHGPQVQFSQPFHPGRPMHGRFKTGNGG